MYLIRRYKELNEGGPAPIVAMFEKKEEKSYLSLAPVNIMSVHLNKDKLKLKTGQTEKLQASLLPHNATDKTVTWHIIDPTIADITVQGELAWIKGKRPGRTVVIATAGAFRDLCVVTVHDYLITNK
jgi:uncharacterized protein YjdB